MTSLLLSKFETYLLDEEQIEFEVGAQQKEQQMHLEEFQLDEKEYPAGFFTSL
jgi:hypothetical protein